MQLRFIVSTAVLALSSVGFSYGDSVIYAMNAGTAGVQVYDANTGVLINTIDTAEMQGNNGRGVVKVGDVLYYTGASSASVYGYNVKTATDLGVVFSVPGASGLATMAYDGKDLFLGDYSGTNNVYKYSLSGSLLQTIPLSQCVGFCDGLEYAQGRLISNEQDGGFGRPSSFDKYDLAGKLLQKGFITTTFGASGIAFDGTDFWVSDIFGGKLDEFNTNGKLVGVTTLQSQTFLIEDLSFDYKVVLGTPEPGSFALLGAGLAGLVALGRRRKATK